MREIPSPSRLVSGGAQEEHQQCQNPRVQQYRQQHSDAEGECVETVVEGEPHGEVAACGETAGETERHGVVSVPLLGKLLDHLAEGVLLGGLGPDANQCPGGGIAVVDLGVDAAGPLQLGMVVVGGVVAVRGVQNGEERIIGQILHRLPAQQILPEGIARAVTAAEHGHREGAQSCTGA